MVQPAPKDRFDAFDAIEIIGNAIGIAATAVAGRTIRTAQTVAKVVETVPKAVKASEKIKDAKAIEKKIDAIVQKGPITKSEAKTLDKLQKQVQTKVQEAVDLGASTAKNSTVAKLTKAVENKVTTAKTESGIKVTQKPRAEEAPGPSNLPKSTVKTSVKKEEPQAPAKTPTKTKAPTKKEVDDAIALAKKAEADEALRIKTLRGLSTVKAGAATAAAASGGDIVTPPPSEVTPEPTPIPPKIEIPDLTPPPGGEVTPPPGSDVTPPPGGDTTPPPTTYYDSGPNFDDGGVDFPPVTDPDPDPDPEEDPKPDRFENLWLILKAKLLAAGLPNKTVEDSVNYFRAIIKDGKFASSPNEINDVVDQYLYLKTYKAKDNTEYESPYYRDFGIYNEKLTKKLLPKDLVPTVLGYKQVASRYNLSPKFTTEGVDGSIQKYLQNEVSVAELDERANAARLRAITADPFYVKSLMQLGFINASSDLTDFFLDPEIGTLELESRRKTAVFSTEAIRRAGQETGIEMDSDFAKQQAARLSALGYSEAQITQAAGTGYENIAEQLRPTEKLSGIYERNLTEGAAKASQIQTELEAEQFLGMASRRRKKLAEQEISAFRGQSGLTGTTLRGTTLGIL